MQSITFNEFTKIYNGQIKQSNQLYHLLSLRYGLSNTACWILYALREEDVPLTQSEMCSTFFLTKQTVNSALKTLEQSGYIRMECSADNRRRKHIYLTEAGKAFCARTIDHLFEIEERAFQRLSEEERAAILALGQKHLDLLHEEAEALLSDATNGG